MQPLSVLLSLTAVAWTAGSVLSAQSPVLDACSVLTQQEITTLSGNHDPGAPDPGGSGANTTCRWGKTGPVTRVALYAQVDPNEPKGLALKQLRERGMKVRVRNLPSSPWSIARVTPASSDFTRRPTEVYCQGR